MVATRSRSSPDRRLALHPWVKQNGYSQTNLWHRMVVGKGPKLQHKMLPKNKWCRFPVSKGRPALSAISEANKEGVREYSVLFGSLSCQSIAGKSHPELYEEFWKQACIWSPTDCSYCRPSLTKEKRSFQPLHWFLGNCGKWPNCHGDSRQLLFSEAWVQSHISQCCICRGKIGTEAEFSRRTWGSLP